MLEQGSRKVYHDVGYVVQHQNKEQIKSKHYQAKRKQMRNNLTRNYHLKKWHTVSFSTEYTCIGKQGQKGFLIDITFCCKRVVCCA